MHKWFKSIHIHECGCKINKIIKNCIIEEFIIDLLHLLVSACLSVYAPGVFSAWGGQTRASDPMVMGLPKVINSLTWVLRTKLGSPAKAARTLNHEPSFQPYKKAFKILISNSNNHEMILTQTVTYIKLQDFKQRDRRSLVWQERSHMAELSIAKAEIHVWLGVKLFLRTPACL